MEEKLGLFFKKIQKKITVLVAINEQKTGFQSVWRVTEAENFRLRRSMDDRAKTWHHNLIQDRFELVLKQLGGVALDP